MKTITDFQIDIAVAASCAEAFDRVCNVSEWWTNDIEGTTNAVDARFTVRFADTAVDFQITDYVPGQSVSWLVTNSYLPWLDNKSEWTGTTVRFDVTPSGAGSQISLTHIGLRSELECFENCSQGWTHFIAESLLKYVRDGKGSPMALGMHATITVPSTAAEAFEAICRVPAWWTTEFEGRSQSPGDEFKVRFGSSSLVEFKVVEMSLGERIVWEVTNCQLEWLDNKTEWTGTKVIWVIHQNGEMVQVNLSHKGLDAASECYGQCRDGWHYFLAQSLAILITDGTGRPGFPGAAESTNE